MNVAFAPEKLKPPTSLQLTYINQAWIIFISFILHLHYDLIVYFTQGSTRHIYVYHDDAEVIVEWYMAIRSAKLNLLQVAHPTQPETEVESILAHYH